jgi:uncharacterized membrane protein YqhA
MAKEDSRYSPGPLPALIFSSRWLQLPLYLGLIVAQGVYVFLFLKELLWQTVIHSVFILSALGIAWTDRIMGAGLKTAAAHR